MLNDEPKVPRYLYNFSLEDITTDIDKMGEHPEVYTLEAGAVEEFPDYVAEILEQALVERELWKSPPANKNMDKRRKALFELVRVSHDLK